MKIKPATGIIKLYMKLCGFKGWASLWNTIYLMPDHMDNQALIRHEAKHIEQMERDGKFVYMVKYIYWMLRYGYLANPYEIEARDAQFNDLT